MSRTATLRSFHSAFLRLEDGRSRKDLRMEQVPKLAGEFDHAGTGHDKNVRGNGMHALVPHRGDGGITSPELDYRALVLFGNAGGIGHVAHIEDDLRAARENFLSRNLRVGRLGVVEYVPAACEFHYLRKI